MVIKPPQAQLHMEVLLRAGIPPIMQVAEPGAQGIVTGIQGMGVRTPSAAAVAAATVGLAIDMHIPNGGMLTMGAQSMIVAAGVPALVRLVGRTFNVEGAMPKVHIIIAPVVTSWGICCSIECVNDGRLNLLGLRLNGAFKDFRLAEIFFGVLSGFLNCRSRFLHIDSAFSVNPKLVAGIHGFGPFLFSIMVNSSSMRWYRRSNFMRGDSNRSDKMARAHPAMGFVSKSFVKTNDRST
jgi:hypothetical protein